MLTWRVHPDKRQTALDAFSQMTSDDDKKDLGNNIRLIGRWHDLSQFTGVAICESDDPQALANWALNWTSNGLLDIETTLVLDDEEARAVGRKRMTEASERTKVVVAN